MAQGVLPFQYSVESASGGMTALAGLPTYLDWAAVSGLTASIERPRKGCAGRSQGWTDRPIVMAWCCSISRWGVRRGPAGAGRPWIRREGFARVLRRVETHGLPRKERRALGGGALRLSGVSVSGRLS
jgi:hypothetical protein